MSLLFYFSDTVVAFRSNFDGTKSVRKLMETVLYVSTKYVSTCLRLPAKTQFFGQKYKVKTDISCIAYFLITTVDEIWSNIICTNYLYSDAPPLLGLISQNPRWLLGLNAS